MVKRIVALVVIFACSMTAWFLLTLVVHVRTDEKNESMTDAVGQLWGEQQTQTAPTVTARWTTENRREVRRSGMEWEYVQPEEREVEVREEVIPARTEKEAAAGETKSESWGAVTTTLVSKEIITEKTKVEPVEKKTAGKGKKEVEEEWVEKRYEVTVQDHSMQLPLGKSDVDVKLDVEHRKKGLLWFATYAVDFDSRYRITNPHDHPVEVSVRFDYPSHGAVYDNMMIRARGCEDLDVDTEHGQMIGTFDLPAGREQQFSFGYQSRGMDRWSYRFGDQVKLVENFSLAMTTNFDQIDFPAGSISPDMKKSLGEGVGWKLDWKKESLVSGLEIGMLMPHKINPGPLAAAMSLHAPVSLFFFFFVLFIMQALKNLKIHPMNYFFIAASFFAFNLLFSYLVNHLDIYLAFGIASVVSIFLVVSYLRIVVGTRFALLEAGLCQFAYQILFSLAHFFEGYTGLTVTIGAVVTLALVMRLTAKVDWGEVFGRKQVPAMSAQAVR